jgi:hypothetical protein
MARSTEVPMHYAAWWVVSETDAGGDEAEGNLFDEGIRPGDGPSGVCFELSKPGIPKAKEASSIAATPTLRGDLPSIRYFHRC